jgi:hypothetical protein
MDLGIGGTGATDNRSFGTSEAGGSGAKELGVGDAKLSDAVGTGTDDEGNVKFGADVWRDEDKTTNQPAIRIPAMVTQGLGSSVFFGMSSLR